MLRTTGRILAITEDDEALIETPRRGSCGNCSARAGCGHGLLAAMVPAASHRVTARLECYQQRELQPGDLVELALPDGLLLEAASRAWLWPLCLMTGGLLAGGAAGEGWAAVGALAGLAGGWLALRHHHRRHADRFLPSIVGLATPSRLSPHRPAA